MTSLLAGGGDGRFEVVNAPLGEPLPQRFGLIGVAGSRVDQNLARGQIRVELFQNFFDDLGCVEADDYALAVGKRIVRPLGAQRDQRIRLLARAVVNQPSPTTPMGRLDAESWFALS